MLPLCQSLLILARPSMYVSRAHNWLCLNDKSTIWHHMYGLILGYKSSIHTRLQMIRMHWPLYTSDGHKPKFVMTVSTIWKNTNDRPWFFKWEITLINYHYAIKMQTTKDKHHKKFIIRVIWYSLCSLGILDASPTNLQFPLFSP